MAYSTINKSSSFMNPVLYNSNGTAIGSGGLTVTGFDFQPDWLFLKQRDADESNGTYDAVRGVTKGLRTNGNNIEDTRTEGVTAFNSNGFTCGSDSRINPSGTHPMVALGWKAGTTSGIAGSPSITPTAYSFNATSGFSIIKWVGTGANATLPHGLGVAPSCIITKDLGGTSQWAMYHKSLGATKYMRPNAVDGASTASNRWNDTEPTSTLFSVGSDAETNASTRNMIAYCFAEVAGYSKFGSYGANNDANGTFIYTGFKPTFFMTKSTATDGSTYKSWSMFDTVRQPTNLNVGKTLYLNRGYGEGTRGQGTASTTIPALDMLSNGVKCRVGNDEINTASDTYIYMAFGQPIISNSGVVATAR